MPIDKLLPASINSNAERVFATKRKVVKFSEKTLIMGILNVTDNSFHDGGKYLDNGEALKQAYSLKE